MNPHIEIKEIPSTNLACLLQIGEYGLDAAFERLYHWAQSNKLIHYPDFRFYRIFHDSFKSTAPDKVRMSLCVPVRGIIEETDDIKNRFLNVGKCLVGHFEIPPEEFTAAWENMFQKFIESGHEKSEKEPFEIIYNDYRSHNEHKSIVDICIPVK